ncbi:MAG: exodeoxyribonuclease VII large subunit, partial [Vulcanococcus sp.]
RDLAASPIPVVTGLGHEDDTTVADLVADYRAATPTAAVVALLPDRESLSQGLQHRLAIVRQLMLHRLQQGQQRLALQRQRLEQCHPSLIIERERERLQQRLQLLEALSPQRLLRRGFSLVRRADGSLLRSVSQSQAGDALRLELVDGKIEAVVEQVSPHP